MNKERWNPAEGFPTGTPPTGASLSYFIWERLLAGVIGGQQIHIPALSGGGGGSNRRPSNDDANNPYSVGVQTDGAPDAFDHRHGGPIPLGKYIIKPPARHPRLGPSARLEPTAQPMLGRSGFLIHGRGRHGSDGCIVPINQDHLKPLLEALTASKGGVLYVEEAMGGARFG